MTPEDWKRIKYFKSQEFDCKTSPGSGANMNLQFLLMLDTLRAKWGMPIKVNSGYRTREYNELVGGKPNSSHLRGLAADLDVGEGYVHVDIDEDLPSPAIWFYPNGTRSQQAVKFAVFAAQLGFKRIGVA